MTSLRPASGRKSLVEGVEGVDPIALQLLNLAASPPLEPTRNHTVPTPGSVGELHDSPRVSHGSHRKKQKMLRAQEAAAEAQVHIDVGIETEAQDTRTVDGAAAISDVETSKCHFPPDQLRALPSSQASIDSNGDGKHVNTNGSNNDVNNATDQATPESQSSSRTGRKARRLPMNKRRDIVLNEETHESDDSEPVPPKPKKKMVPPKKRSSAASPNEIQYTMDYTEDDILLGQSRFNKHPGNERYRNVVREYRTTFAELYRIEIARKIVDHIYEDIGGRFLKFDKNNRWKIMADEDVMTKVAKAIVEIKELNLGKIIPVRNNPVRNQPEEVEPQTSSGRPKRKKTLTPKKYNDDVVIDMQESWTGSKKKRKISETPAILAKKPAEQFMAVEQTYEEYIYRPDPNPFYIEETAHLYHNPPFPSKWTNGVAREDLRPIPPPPPLPSFPNTGSCRWSFDETSRVLIADFSVNKNESQPVVTLVDSKFFFEMYERDDITVVSRGLLNTSKTDSSLWGLGYLRNCVGREFYHKFRRFDRVVNKDGIVSNTEKDSLYSMRFADYVDYCGKRESYWKGLNGENSSGVEEPTFTFEDHKGKSHEVGVWTSALYMIDVDMNRLLPLLNKNFLDSFELPAVLPGGSHCMMHSVTPDARPFMGPNLYVTPPASFTHFHQDGHGTVDSGHLCISGYNEVVMLRRLTERHKKHALWILSGRKPEGSHFDGLYSMPHGDGLGQKPPWPSHGMIEECKKMGYCPSVFTLEPGDLVHINKGRLHAFRKMSTSKLAEGDCHAERRRSIVESKGIAGTEQLCVSVAWDWMYRGVTSGGINRETCTVLEGSTLNRRNGVTSLAIPELSLLQMAKTIPAMNSNTEQNGSFLDALGAKEKVNGIYESTKTEICNGIYPGLTFVVGQHIKALNVEESKSTMKGERLSIAKIPDTQEDPLACPLDPYGDSDFECKLCRKELSNVYFHCDGCEKLLSKDFNICRGCYVQKKFMIRVQMHPSNTKKHAALNHTGDPKFDRESRCPCKNGPACNFCGYCLGCSCRCHSWFTMRTRLCNANDEENMLRSVQCIAVPTSLATEGNVMKGDRKENNAGEMAESIRYLRDRLKDAGDEELLNEERKLKADAKEIETAVTEPERKEAGTTGTEPEAKEAETTGKLETKERNSEEQTASGKVRGDHDLNGEAKNDYHNPKEKDNGKNGGMLANVIEEDGVNQVKVKQEDLEPDQPFVTIDAEDGNSSDDAISI